MTAGERALVDSTRTAVASIPGPRHSSQEDRRPTDSSIENVRTLSVESIQRNAYVEKEQTKDMGEIFDCYRKHAVRAVTAEQQQVLFDAKKLELISWGMPFDNESVFQHVNSVIFDHIRDFRCIIVQTLQLDTRPIGIHLLATVEMQQAHFNRIAGLRPDIRVLHTTAAEQKIKDDKLAENAATKHAELRKQLLANGRKELCGVVKHIAVNMLTGRGGGSKNSDEGEKKKKPSSTKDLKAFAASGLWENEKVDLRRSCYDRFTSHQDVQPHTGDYRSIVERFRVLRHRDGGEGGDRYQEFVRRPRFGDGGASENQSQCCEEYFIKERCRASSTR